MHFKRLVILIAILQILQETFVGENFFFANMIDTLAIFFLFQDEKNPPKYFQSRDFFSLNTSLPA